MHIIIEKYSFNNQSSNIKQNNFLMHNLKTSKLKKFTFKLSVQLQLSSIKKKPFS
jgi:hypothetical protein